MIRFCYQTTSKVTLITKPDGSYTVEGLGGADYMSFMRVYERYYKPFNISFFVTSSAEECLSRLERNESDTSNLLVPIYSQSNRYEPSDIYITGETQFFTGYNIIEGQNREKQTAIAIANAYLLDAEVYGWFLFLLLNFILCTALRVWLQLSLTRRSSALTTARRLCRRLNRAFASSTGSIRWIKFLYSILIFYMVTSFMCLYKTSQVIVDTPFYPKTYQESLDYKTSVAFFYDQFIEVSSTFRDAPVASVKRQLWEKHVKSGKKDRFRFEMKGPNGQAKFISSIVDGMKYIAKNKDIVIGAGTALPLTKAVFLALGAENELWFIKTMTDPSEGEVHYGVAFRKGAKKAFSVKRQQRYYQSQLAAINYVKAGQRAGEKLSQMMGTSRRHQVRQMIMQEDEHAFVSGVHVRAIPLEYFSSFFAACVIIWAVAFLINFLDCH